MSYAGLAYHQRVSILAIALAARRDLAWKEVGTLTKAKYDKIVRDYLEGKSPVDDLFQNERDLFDELQAVIDY